jgi:hopanoid C-2 methylase
LTAPNRKRILIVNCYFDEFRVPVKRRLKFPQPMAPSYLAGIFSAARCDIRLYDELYSGPLEDEDLLSFPDMLVLTGVNSAFDRMLHLTAYVKTKNPRAVAVAGGPAIRALPCYAKKFFDYACTGDIEQLGAVIEEVFGRAWISEYFRQTGWVIPRYDLTYWMKTMNFVESSRYCYYRCSYCSLTAERVRYQPYALEYLRQQFLTLGKKRMVHFLDNNFASREREFMLQRFALMKDLQDQGYLNLWGAEVTSDFFLNRDYVEMAREVGCAALFCGVESFSKKALQNFRKYHNNCLPQVEMIRDCLNAGVAFLYGIVLDPTTRSLTELKAELDFILDTPEITLPSYVTLAIPLLGTPYFYECLAQRRFLPDIKLRDLDAATLALKPMDGLEDTVRFIRTMQTFSGYKRRVVKHMKEFYRKYRRVLSWQKMMVLQYSALHLCLPKLATLGSDIGSLLDSNGRRGAARTYIGTSEPLDSVYKPAFRLDSKFAAYFRPTMLTDGQGNLNEDLQADLLAN